MFLLSRSIGLVLALLAAGCRQLPDYPPPPQREPLARMRADGLSDFLNMANPNADAYIGHLVSIDPDKIFVATDGAKLAFPLARVGFVE